MSSLSRIIGAGSLFARCSCSQSFARRLLQASQGRDQLFFALEFSQRSELGLGVSFAHERSCSQ